MKPKVNFFDEVIYFIVDIAPCFYSNCSVLLMILLIKIKKNEKQLVIKTG